MGRGMYGRSIWRRSMRAGTVAIASLMALSSVALAQQQPAAASEPGSVVLRSIRVLKRVEPVMPRIAIDEGIEGHVEMQITIGTKGTVTDVTVQSAVPPGVFEDAAIAAIRQWLFEPNTRQGKPFALTTLWRLNFRLPPPVPPQ
jgi:periplasmic protein TonB